MLKRTTTPRRTIISSSLFFFAVAASSTARVPTSATSSSRLIALATPATTSSSSALLHHRQFHSFKMSSAASTASTAASSKPLTLVPGKTKIGFIGIGVMGLSMAGHILKKAGYPMIVYNRTKEKCAPLEAAGAKVANSIEEVAENSDIVFSIVAFPSDVRSVYLGSSTTKGVLSILRPGSIICDMTTSEPSIAREIYTAAAEKGICALDAPVSGGDLGARNATLSIMVGGDQVALDAMRPLFEAMGKNITLCGTAGSGQHTKMVNQILIASGMIGVVEGLLYAQKAGLDPLTTISAVQAGAAGSWSITNLGPKIAARDFNPGFFVEHFIKDLGIALNEANRMGLALPGLALANQLYVSVKALGAGRLATTALTLALEAMNGIQPVEKK